MLRKILDYEWNWVKQHEKEGISIGIAYENPDGIKLKYAVMNDFEKKEINNLKDDVRNSFDF